MLAAARVAARGLLIAMLATASTLGASAQEQRPMSRLALVISEGAYPQGRLPTATADAGLMASAFAQAGFDVTAIADADAALLRTTVAGFAAKARAAGPGVALAVYVAGDGLQFSGENWLVPVGATIERADAIPNAALRLAELTGPLEAIPASTRLFLFDLARANPFARDGTPSARGLALVDAPVGSIYAMNTAPGAVAPAEVQPYGVYARALAEAIQAPGLTLDQMLRRVRLRVGERTDGAAVPFDDGSADPGFAFFKGPPTGRTPLAVIAGLSPARAYSTAVARDTLPGYADFIAAFPRDPLANRVRAMAAVRREALIWSEAVRANNPRAYWTYIRRYPRGPHFGDVRRQLNALHAALEPPPRFEIVPFEGLPPPPPYEAAMLEHTSLGFRDADGPAIPTPPASLLPAVRNAFFEALPPPPIAPAGALPLPLPVPTPGGQGHPSARIEQPAVPGGALLSTLAEGQDGVEVTTVRTGGPVVSRVTEASARNITTVNERDAAGASIAKMILATGADGALTMTQTGPAGRPIARSVSRDAAGGARATTLFDASGVLIATTIVSAAEIVTVSAIVRGRPLLPHLVLAANPDARGGPVVMPETGLSLPVLRSTRVPATEALTPVATEEIAPHEDTAPAMPAVSGLTGQAPALDIPAPSPAPAFDAAAAPVGAAPPAVPDSAKAASSGTQTAKLPGIVAAPSSQTETAKPAAGTPLSVESDANRLPLEPPLPPRRVVPAGGRAGRRGGH